MAGATPASGTPWRGTGDGLDCRSGGPSIRKGFHSSAELIQMVVMLYERFPLSLRNVEDLAFERGIDIRHATLRLWVNRFGPMFAAKIRSQRVLAISTKLLDHVEIGLNQSNLEKRDRSHLFRAGCGRKTGSHFSSTRSRQACRPRSGRRCRLRPGRRVAAFPGWSLPDSRNPARLPT